MKIYLVAACTLCGRISPPVMGSREDRRFLETMRAETDASLMGAGSLRRSDPEMRGPGGQLPEERIRAIMTFSGRIPVRDRRLFSAEGPRPVVFTSEQGEKHLREILQDRGLIKVLPTGPGGLSIPAAMDELAGMGALSVLVEGGGRLNYACLQAKIVDELCVTMTPFLSGDKAAASLADGPQPLALPFLKLMLLSCTQAENGEIFLRYALKK
jgi:riboflavin biosynthesis pyrimidine reductase